MPRQIIGAYWEVEELVNQQGYVASGRGTLSSVVRVWYDLSSTDKFLVPDYFPCALFVRLNNAQTSNTFYQKQIC